MNGFLRRLLFFRKNRETSPPPSPSPFSLKPSSRLGSRLFSLHAASSLQPNGVGELLIFQRILLFSSLRGSSPPLVAGLLFSTGVNAQQPIVWAHREAIFFPVTDAPPPRFDKISPSFPPSSNDLPSQHRCRQTLDYIARDGSPGSPPPSAAD